mmetsp:Transcript_7506/g.19555  ORF Transcript_7506/g.19555 Transcript_7506/m.19555 type:complete len:128 (-) Transcript_7506:33-416(-)
MLARRLLLSGAWVRGGRSLPRRGLAGPPGGSTNNSSKQLVADDGWSKYEGWEPTVYTTYILATVILVVGLGNKPQTSILQWAREEAEARMKAIAAGETVEYGTHYAKESPVRYTKEGVGEVPEIDEE